MKRKTERDRFEAWCKRKHYFVTRERESPNCYWWNTTAAAWEAWQAAKRDARREEK